MMMTTMTMTTAWQRDDDNGYDVTDDSDVVM